MNALAKISSLRRVDVEVREGRFQRWLSLIAGLSCVLSGLEVAYEHYRGGYSRRVMYTPVMLSGALMAGGIAGFFSRTAARTFLPAISGATLADGVIGFYFHARGLERKPGGWRLPVTNMVMGPPIFAPLLFGVSAYLGLIASLLKRGEKPGKGLIPLPAHSHHWALALTGRHERIGRVQDVREGRFQQQMIAATMISAFFSGFEAWYSHYKNNFRYKAQWTPIIIAPLLIATGAHSLKNPRTAQTWLPAISAIAMLDGAAGFFYHARGVVRRPGGLKKPLYNVIYGPPVFAPLLFAACGFLGILASLLRREPRKMS
jgi:hypothetical protein